jgi:hypothetical protein
MTKLRSLPLLLVFALWPSLARADGIIDWIEKMSGPGPWKGVGFDLLFCIDKTHKVAFECWRRPAPNEHRLPEDERHIIDIAVVRYWTLANRPRFDDIPGDTRGMKLLRIEPQYAYRFHRAIDVGVGVGFWRFSGEEHGDFDPFWTVTFTPINVLFSPLALLQRDVPRKWQRVFQLQVAESLLTGLDGADFDSPTKFKSGKELVTRYGIRIDLVELFRHY